MRQNNQKRYYNPSQFDLFLFSFEGTMKDEELYEMIQRAVHQRKRMPSNSCSKTFAERYCEKQLQKKYKPHHNNQQKIGTIMHDFRQLETYFNLPDLIKQLHHMKVRQEIKGQAQNRKPKDSDGEEFFQEKKRPNSRHFSELRNIRLATESWKMKNFISTLEDDNEWRGETVKNNSVYHMHDIDQEIKEAEETQESAQSVRLFKMLKSFMKEEKQHITKENRLDIQGKTGQSQKKRQTTKFLHKVSSYLQIILENEHRNKWSKKRSDEMQKFNSTHNTVKLMSKEKVRKIRINKKKKPVTLVKDMSDINCIQAIKEHTRMLRGDEEEEETNLLKPSLTKTHDFPRWRRQEGDEKKKSKEPSYFTSLTSSVHQRQKQNIKNNNSAIKETFTFRRRSVKEKIIKKIDKFICHIDEETHSNKKENHYYSNEINKLEHHLKRLYGRYRKETIAGDQDIENLKKLAQMHSVLTPSRKISKAEDQHSQSAFQESKLDKCQSVL